MQCLCDFRALSENQSKRKPISKQTSKDSQLVKQEVRKRFWTQEIISNDFIKFSYLTQFT